jgi:tetratricopeptide (TPR) repeat protein
MTVKPKFMHVFSDANQLARIVVLTGVLLVLVLVSFSGYYYFDRYTSPVPSSQDTFVVQAEQMVRDDPQNLEKRLALAETYMFNEYFLEAVVQANQVLSLYPDTERAWLVLGVSSARLGKPADAIEPLTKFIDARKGSEMPGLDKSLQAAAYYLGDSYLQQGRAQDAIEPLKLAVEWSRMDADAMYKLGVAFNGIQDYPNAVMMLHAATTFVPNYLEAYEAMAVAYDSMLDFALGDYARGMAAFSRKEYAAAVDLLLRSAQVRSDFAPTFTGLGLAYEAMGEIQLARDSYHAAVQFAPNSLTANRGVERTEVMLKSSTQK